ncbi:PREDICTED: uncharacterized protein LOC109475973 [Branchiostoma belcheri]|uniref:Uncharacterized protein LOC109475973 n=1 Tax=Branchiostoma belcheri TaxID=7741 RepID=A0A6P4Z6R0_BRABE|nr:PREDICTED: uncharacterized protein LOC109475973 [Branchiostoma belcheri]
MGDDRVIRIKDANGYNTMKTYIGGLVDVSLFTSNISQLVTITRSTGGVDTGQEIGRVVLLAITMFLQVVLMVILIYQGSVDINKLGKRTTPTPVNSAVTQHWSCCCGFCRTAASRASETNRQNEATTTTTTTERSWTCCVCLCNTNSKITTKSPTSEHEEQVQQNETKKTRDEQENSLNSMNTGATYLSAIVVLLNIAITALQV